MSTYVNHSHKIEVEKKNISCEKAKDNIDNWRDFYRTIKLASLSC